jgi:hypothetical protein
LFYCKKGPEAKGLRDERIRGTTLITAIHAVCFSGSNKPFALITGQAGDTYLTFSIPAPE